jgi:outer membrane protein OmpA-like peptidoglycan-associated protein
MRHFLQLLLLLFFGIAAAQEEVIQSVYFDLNKYTLDENQAKAVVDYIRSTDSTLIESIEIFGYTDDTGKDAYNFKLSTNRANTIKDVLTENGIKNKVIVTIEGKGKIMIDDDLVENLPEKRSKNRRVDVVLNLKPLPKIQMPGMYTEMPKKPVVGDHVYLENVLFNRGSSSLTFKAKTQLDMISRYLMKHKNIEFEIQGHICCTPPYQKEAIDLGTRKRQLSSNRAQAVYKYLVFKKIDKKRMTFKGYGNTVPLGKGQEYDRRVEIVVTKV